MAIPVAYNFRNLIVRKTTSIMTALGIALTVAVLLAILAMVNGLRTSLEATGNPLNVLVMRKGSDSELVSNFARTVFQDLKFKDGIARSQSGEPLASLETISIINLPSLEQPDGINITLRGLDLVGVSLRDGIKLSAGRWFTPGRREVVVGRHIAKQNPAAAMGNKLRFGKGEWEVVGVMDAGKGASNSEIFADLNQVGSDFNRLEVASSALVRAVDAVTLDALVKSLQDDPRLNVSAKPEKEYYAAQTSTALPIQIIGMFIAVVMAVGSSFAAMNTMYAAVARRSREIGTLRILGFSQSSILFSFFLESLMLSVAGGVLGCLLVLPLNGITTGMLSFSTFSVINFDFTISPRIMLWGIAFAAFMGAIGGLFPARMAAKKEILTALREI